MLIRICSPVQSLYILAVKIDCSSGIFYYLVPFPQSVVAGSTIGVEYWIRLAQNSFAIEFDGFVVALIAVRFVACNFQLCSVFFPFLAPISRKISPRTLPNTWSDKEPTVDSSTCGRASAGSASTVGCFLFASEPNLISSVLGFFAVSCYTRFDRLLPCHRIVLSHILIFLLFCFSPLFLTRFPLSICDFCRGSSSRIC